MLRRVSPIKRLRRSVHSVINIFKWAEEDVLAQARAALLKPVQKRDNFEIAIIERLMSKLNFFIKIRQNYGLALFEAICRNLYYKRAEKDAVLIKINTEGKTFHVILTGSVGINIYLPKENVEITSDKRKSQLFEKQEVNVLHSGVSFGELALLNPDARTTATVIAKEFCEFACMDREQFIGILGEIGKKELQDKIGFLSQLNFLQGWYETDIKTLSYHFEAKLFQRNQTVFKEDEGVGEIFFVKRGEVKLFKKYRSEMQLSEQLDSNVVNIKKRMRVVSEIEVCNIIAGETFGEEGLMHLVGIGDRRQFKAVVSACDTEIFRIGESDLLKRVWMKKSKEVLYKVIREKWKFRLERYNERVREKKERVALHESLKNEEELLTLASKLNPEKGGDLVRVAKGKVSSVEAKKQDTKSHRCSTNTSQDENEGRNIKLFDFNTQRQRTENELKQSYYLRELRKMQQRFKTLQLIQKGKIKLGPRQSVNDQGQVVDIPESQDDDEHGDNLQLVDGVLVPRRPKFNFEQPEASQPTRLSLDSLTQPHPVKSRSESQKLLNTNKKCTMFFLDIKRINKPLQNPDVRWADKKKDKLKKLKQIGYFHRNHYLHSQDNIKSHETRYSSITSRILKFN